MIREPNCNHKATVRVSSHEDLHAAYESGADFASVYSCDRPKCREAAVFYVQGTTGKQAVVVSLSRGAK